MDPTAVNDAEVDAAVANLAAAGVSAAPVTTEVRSRCRLSLPPAPGFVQLTAARLLPGTAAALASFSARNYTTVI